MLYKWELFSCSLGGIGDMPEKANVVLGFVPPVAQTVFGVLDTALPVPA